MSRHLESDLTAYLDGALSPERVALVEEHLTACAECRARKEQLAGALQLLASLPAPPEPSPDFARRFYARLDAEPAPRPTLAEVFRRLRWRYLVPLAGGVATMVVVIGTASHYRAEQANLARGLDLYENYELVAGIDAVDSPEDVEVVGHLHELTGGGRP